jgi:hypothetical protein
MFEREWLHQASRSRALRVTERGQEGLHATFGIEVA